MESVMGSHYHSVTRTGWVQTLEAAGFAMAGLRAWVAKQAPPPPPHTHPISSAAFLLPVRPAWVSRAPGKAPRHTLCQTATCWIM